VKTEVSFFLSIKILYGRKMPKNDINIENENKYIWKLDCNISLMLFTIKNPPEEITVSERLYASNALRFIILYIKNNINVIVVYTKRIFVDCFIISLISKEIKFVRIFL